MATVADRVRELLTGRYFLILEQGVLLAEGTILDALNAETVLADVWRDGNPETTTLHVFSLVGMNWNEATQSGIVLTQQRLDKE